MAQIINFPKKKIVNRADFPPPPRRNVRKELELRGKESLNKQKKVDSFHMFIIFGNSLVFISMAILCYMLINLMVFG